MVQCTALTQHNSFRALAVTDGRQSYAVFSYKCGAINWGNTFTIGFKASNIFYENFDLGEIDVTDLGCTEDSEEEYVTYVYDLTPSEIPAPGIHSYIICITIQHRYTLDKG